MLQLSLDSRPQDKQTTRQYDPALVSLKVCYVTIKFQTPKKDTSRANLFGDAEGKKNYLKK